MQTIDRARDRRVPIFADKGAVVASLAVGSHKKRRTIEELKTCQPAFKRGSDSDLGQFVVRVRFFREESPYGEIVDPILTRSHGLCRR